VPTLVLPASLAQLCALPRELEVPGSTAAEVLSGAARAHPALGRHLLDEAGEPRRHYSIFKNDLDLRTLGGLQAEVLPEDVVTVLPPVAGGGGAPGGKGPRPQQTRGAGTGPGWLAEAAAHAEAAYPEEACGLVVRDAAGGLSCVRCRNLAPDPRVRFEVDPALVLDALRSGRLHGVYHSHPDGPARPSAEDLERAGLWGAELEWTVVSVRAGHAGAAGTYRGPEGR